MSRRGEPVGLMDWSCGVTEVVSDCRYASSGECTVDPMGCVCGASGICWRGKGLLIGDVSERPSTGMVGWLSMDRCAIPERSIAES